MTIGKCHHTWSHHLGAWQAADDSCDVAGQEYDATLDDRQDVAYEYAR